MSLIHFHSACLLFLLFAVTAGSGMGQQTTLDNSTIRVVVTVTDSSGRPLPGLTQEQFSVFEKKAPLDITYFDAEDRPVSIAFVFDVSESMTPSMMKTSVQLAGLITSGSNSASEYAIIGLKDTPQVFCELGCSEANTAKAFQQMRTMSTRKNAQTALYDGCYLALKTLESSKNAKRTVIVFSDGQDNSSKLSFTRLRNSLKESEVIFYAIGLIQTQAAGTSLGQEGAAILDELCATTGGKAYFPREKSELAPVADVIALQLRQQYTIGFKPTAAAADNKWHSIKIKLTMLKTGKPSSPYVRYREGYFSH